MSKQSSITICVSVFVFLAGCTGTAEPPAISDISLADRLVRVQAINAASGNLFEGWPSEQSIIAEGQRGCQQFKKPAVLVSSRCVNYMKDAVDIFGHDYCKIKEYLFACR